MKSARLLIVILATALLAGGQISARNDYRIRVRGKDLIVKYKGRAHRLETAAQIDAAKITGTEILYARRKGDFTYLVIDVFGRSRAAPNDRQCGAGTEANLLWIKLDAKWKIAGLQTVRYESCWSSIDMGDGLKISGHQLRLEFENFREDLHVKLTYHADEPERGFEMVVSKLKDISKLLEIS